MTREEWLRRHHRRLGWREAEYKAEIRALEPRGYRVVAVSLPRPLLTRLDAAARQVAAAGLTQRPNRSFVVQRAVDLMRQEIAGMTADQLCRYFARLYAELGRWLARRSR